MAVIVHRLFIINQLINHRLKKGIKMIRLINLNEHKNKFGLEAHQEAKEIKEIIDIFDLIKIDYPDLSMVTCKIIELSSEVVVGSILELLRKNMGSRRMESLPIQNSM